ncbi:caspase family protein [Oceaniglobus trochenteri]|uniref:caspase family protein n=1 Tax=Oceaniglobus trochenteri TaxID=2763260 RepID=UPI001CFFE4A9|nr:caspase family protein [Oceaniglobus trochenteri]
MRLLFAALISIVPIAAPAADRIALVIGMGAYQTVPTLDNPVNDARAIGETLERIGFEVTTLIDTPGETLRKEVGDFAFHSETADLALIYYAGHGVEVQGENFLIPVDASITTNRDIQRVSLSLDDLLAAVDGARKMRVVILDSCRDDPFGGALDLDALQDQQTPTPGTRGAGDGGLAPPSPDRGTLVAFAARDGEVALDGAGEHSPFAKALIDALPQPVEISLMFRQVRDAVLRETGNRQEPHTYGSLSGTPFFLARDAVETASFDPDTAWSEIPRDQETQLATLADQGDTRSMVGLAYMRLNAADPRYAPTDAAGLLERAAKAGSAEAQFELAQLYEKGLGVAQDDKRALELYESAAALGFADALNDLGFIHFQGGLGVPLDPARGLEYFEQAANLRQPQAMYNFAALIDDGAVPGKGPQDAANYLYRALRTGAQDVYEVVRDRPRMFEPETRRALQLKLREFGFYDAAIDGDFGPGTQSAIRAAYGLSE